MRIKKSENRPMRWLVNPYESLREPARACDGGGSFAANNTIVKLLPPPLPKIPMTNFFIGIGSVGICTPTALAAGKEDSRSELVTDPQTLKDWDKTPGCMAVELSPQLNPT
jgi:hypothetical protein